MALELDGLESKDAGICKKRHFKPGLRYAIVCNGIVQAVLSSNGVHPDVIGTPIPIVEYRCSFCGTVYKKHSDFDSHFSRKVQKDLDAMKKRPLPPYKP